MSLDGLTSRSALLFLHQTGCAYERQVRPKLSGVHRCDQSERLCLQRCSIWAVKRASSQFLLRGNMKDDGTYRRREMKWIEM